GCKVKSPDSFVRFLRLLLTWIILTTAPVVVAVPGTITKEQVRTITSSGKQITSIFDGLAPNRHVRDILVLRINRTRIPNLCGLNNRPFARMFKLMLVAEPPVFLSCPTGGVCATPGSTSAPGQFCADPSGCAVDVHNQTSTNDFTRGTMELYD